MYTPHIRVCICNRPSLPLSPPSTLSNSISLNQGVVFITENVIGLLKKRKYEYEINVVWILEKSNVKENKIT